MTRGHELIAGAIALLAVSVALLYVGAHFAEDHGRFVCSVNGEGAEVVTINGQTTIYPTGWHCDYREWQRTGRINVVGTP